VPSEGQVRAQALGLPGCPPTAGDRVEDDQDAHAASIAAARASCPPRSSVDP
jgi:hypothetical protein